MAQQAELPQADTSLESRFADYAEKAHPEIFDDLPPEERPASTQIPREGTAPTLEKPTQATSPEPTQTETQEQPTEEVRFQFENLSDLAKQLDVPVETILALKTDTEIDGVKGSFSLADIRKGFQLDQHNTNKSKSLSEAQSKVDALRQQYEGYNRAAEQQHQTLQALGKYAKEVLNNQYKDVNWQALQIQDPTQYIMHRQAFQDQNTAIDNFIAQVNQQSQNQQAQLQQQQQAQTQETLKNRASIRSEWADEGVFIKDTQAIREVALSSGLKAEELPILLTNPAYLKMADMATRWANLQKQKPEVTQRVKTAPQLVKATSRTAQIKPSALANFKAQLQKNPKDRDTQEGAFAEWASEAARNGLL